MARAFWKRTALNSFASSTLFATLAYMGLLPKLVLALFASAVLLSRAQSARGQAHARPVTRGLVMGDSIAAHGTAVEVLREQTRAPWTNLAVVGANSAAVLRQAQSALRQQGRFSHIVVMAGVNDGDRSSAFTKANLAQIYQLGKSMGAQVIAVTETPFRQYLGWTNAAQIRQNDVVGWLTTRGRGMYADRVVDAHTQFTDRDHPGYLDARYAAPDGLHLNSDGQRFLGALIVQAIRR
jgi:lysophospholipase L1-like esterase